MLKKEIGWIALLLVSTSTSFASNEPNNDQTINELKAIVADLQNQVNELKGQLNADWMTEQRANEIKGIVQDVLADADMRASLLQGGMLAGHDGKNFFLASADGNYLLKLKGHLQVRYIWNSRDEDGGPAIDEDVSGFQIRRSKLAGEGHIINPDLEYGFSIAGDSDENTMFFEDYFLEYNFKNGMKLRAGQWKQPFARENFTSSSAQMAVERSLVLETFNVDRSEGVMLSGGGDNLKWAFAFNDGIDGEFSDFDSNDVDFGFTGRVDVLLDGDWKQMKDFAAWRGEETAAFLGGAFHYQEGEGDTALANDSVLLLTADGSFESDGLGVFAAIYYSDIDFGMANASNYGFEAAASYKVSDAFEPFVRYELIMLDDSIVGLVEDDINILTFGFNWYHDKHNAKLTVDLVYVADHIDDDFSSLTMLDPSTGLGLLDDTGTEGGQIAFRSQYQIKF